MRKQIYNLNCRKQTSRVKKQRPWRGARGSTPGGVLGAASLARSKGQRPWRGPRGSAPGGVPGAAPLVGSKGQRPWRGPRGSPRLDPRLSC